MSWALFAVAVQAAQPALLLLLGGPVLAAALVFCGARLHTLLRRTRWIMISLLLIYAYATPGEALFAQLGAYSPTLEGAQDGLLQLGRLSCMLAALAMLLAGLNRQQLIGGLYVLAYPLRYLGVSRERIAVRLALTLHYADSVMLDASADWRASLEKLLAPAEAKLDGMVLHAVPFTPRDILLLAAGCCAALALVLL